jgi:AcrR family transcriptional regulator
MLIERGLSVGLDHVRLAEVAEAAGRTTGAAYHIWGSSEGQAYGGGQARFHLELARRAVETIGVDHRTALAVVEQNPGASLHELIRQGARQVLDRFTDPQVGWDVVLGLVAAVRSTPELLDAHRKAFAELTDSYCALFGPVLERLGRRVRPPFTLEQLTVSVIALADGFGIRVLVDPDAVPTDIALPTGPDGADEPWHLFACAVEAMFEHFTEEIDAADV